MEDALLKWRSQFPITQTTTYLNNNSLGAMPKSARGSLERYADLWEKRGVRAWAEGWWTIQNEITEPLSEILGVKQDAISMHQNVTMASQVFCSALDFSSSRNKVVFTQLNFPSLMYLYEGLAKRVGAEIVRVPSDDGIEIPTQRLLDAIDDKTALVPISHVLFRSAFIQDAEAIIEKAHQVGAIVLLDVFQSVGTVPLELEQWGCHSAVGGALKFLCGGPGACFLYVNPSLGKSLSPAFTGWMAHKDPFAFDPGPQNLREDGWRFLNGTPNVPGIFAAKEGVRILAEVGIKEVRKKSMRQTALIAQKAEELGFQVNAPQNPEERGGTIAVDVPQGYFVCQELLSRDIIVDYRPKAGIRIAPHFYTKDDECLSVLSHILEILETDAWKKHSNSPKRPG
jgi:kynureninase